MNSKIGVTQALTAITIGLNLVIANPVFAGATYHNVPGVACGAFNNAQANKLVRDHSRIFLPLDASGPLFVICPLHRVREDMEATASFPVLWVNAFFDIGVPTGTQISCGYRYFNYLNLNVPGRAGSPPLESKTVIAAKTAAIGVAQAIDQNVSFTVDAGSNSFRYYTAACKLEPGTGINSFDFNQR